MAPFEPQPNDHLSFHVDGIERWFLAVEHPHAPSMVHAMEGGKATVYRLRDLRGASEYALKVLRAKHRGPMLEDVCAFLDQFKHRPGLSVCERLCLSPARAAKTLGEYSSLEYAILMPWVFGVSWFDLLVQGHADLDQGACLTLATHLADVLSGLEGEGMAHCDLSSGNLLFDRGTLQVELIDVEDLFASAATPPKALPAGTPGYQHCTSATGQWGAQADRFAGAVLLSEILGWYDSSVRSSSYGESFFDPAEMQRDSFRFSILEEAVRRQRPKLGDLLRKAWHSRTLDECPPLCEWSQACRGVTWKPLSPSPAIGTSVKPFWKPLPLSGPSQGVTVHWKQGDTTPASGGNVTWKGGVKGNP